MEDFAMKTKTLLLSLLCIVGITTATAQSEIYYWHNGFPVKVQEVDSITFTPPVSTPHAGEIYTVNGVDFTMVPIDGGTFNMGFDGEDAFDREKPVHPVKVSSFSIGQTEVTQALWEAVMGSNPSFWRGLNLPVEKVSWNDCQEFITKLNQLTGLNFRLPTEAEWEFAARGGNYSKGYKYSGSDNLEDVAWYKEYSEKNTHEVATKQPNELGLYDMSGNVQEWCQDYFDANYYRYSPIDNPKGALEKFYYHVYRGGSYHDITNRGCRVYFRFGTTPTASEIYRGLRLAL